MTQFSQYTDIILSAFKHNPKNADVVNKKQEILNTIFDFHNLTPTSILFVGFNPAILSAKQKEIYVTEVSQEALDFLTAKKINFKYIDPAELDTYNKKIQCVVALDEYFTFAKTDSDQRALVNKLTAVATEYIITTVRDYKNQDYKDREFSIPTVVRNGQKNKLFLEFHDYDIKDKNIWDNSVHEIDEDDVTKHGIFKRRNMFFKQLAKFSLDAGADNFLVHKNLMYKSLIRKNYEHVVSIRFDN